MRQLLLAASCVLLLACQNNEPKPGPAPVPSSVSIATVATVAPRPPVSAAPVATATASAAPSASADAASARPTEEEWKTGAEVSVTGLTAAGCQTKRVREWVGVFCTGANDTLGTPVKVKVNKAETLHAGAPVEQRKDVMTSSEEGKVTLTARYVAGTDVEATFSWTDKEKHLTLWWPADKPEPHILGAFK